MWSVACIFSEILSRTPLFPGRNHKDLVEQIIKVLGTPCIEDLEQISDPEAKEFINSLPIIEKSS